MNLSHNSIRSLPESLGTLPCLNKLHVSNNNLTTLPTTVSSALECIIVDGNALYELNTSLAHCINLTTISAKDNSIRQVSTDVLALPLLSVLALQGNRLDLCDVAERVKENRNKVLYRNLKMSLPCRRARLNQQCAQCDKTGIDLRKCRCGVSYCNKICQAANWQVHKSGCTHLNKKADSNNGL